MESNNMAASSRREIPPLTGLRFFAAVFVCLAHIVPYVVPGLDDPTISRLSAEGMTLFFVLSGFVIHYNYSSKIIENPARGIYNFFVSRFARLYPLYFFCLCLDLVKNYGYSSLPSSFSDAIPFYLTLTQSWFYVPLGDHSLIYQFGLMPSVSWSVSTEWFFYLFYPAICLMLVSVTKLRSKIKLLSIIFMVMPLLVAITFFSQATISQLAVKTFGSIAETANSQDSFYRWLIYFSPYSRISEFLVGCFTASIYMQVSVRKPSRHEERVGLIVLICSLVSVIILHHFIFHPPKIHALSWLQTLHQCFGFALPAALIIFCSARYHNFISRFLSNPTILLGGEISYSMYLLHLPIAEAFSRDAAPVSSFIVGIADASRLLIALAAVLGAALVSYHFLEVPARRFMRKLLIIHSKKVISVVESS